MSDLVFSVRDSLGNIINRQDYHGKNVLRFECSYDDRISELEQLPKYTRGKVKDKLMHRIVPQCDGGGMELIIRDDFWEERFSWGRWLSNDTELFSYENIRVPDTCMYIKCRNDFWTVQSLVESFERCACSDIRHLYSVEDLEKVNTIRLMLIDLM